MHFEVDLVTLFMCVLFIQCSISNAIPCDSCGNECASACGTKHFRTCCFNYLRKRSDPDTNRLITNKRLIDFIMLQGRAMFTEDELSREQDLARRLRAAAAREQGHRAHKNGTIIDIGLGTYYV